MNLKEKTILVTGASSGIGQAIAVECAQKGATVIIHYRKNREGAQHTLREIKQRVKNTKAHIVQADLTKTQAVKKMFHKIAQTAGTLDILVNNAGQARPGDFFDNASWENQFQNILFSARTAAQHFLKQNTKSPLRKMVNITSYYGNLESGNPEYFAYSVAKAALASMTMTLAKQNANVLVNAVAPGYTWTPAWEGTSKAEKKLCESRTRIGRFITPEEVAHITAAILENDAITGQVITIDGGLSLTPLEKK